MSEGTSRAARPMKMKTLAGLIVAAGLTLFGPAWGRNEGFVSVEGTAFTLNGEPFHYVGTNNYYLMTHAADRGLRWQVDEVLEKAAAMGLKVVRTWAFNDGEGEWNALQTRPGVYQESVFRGLDYVLYKADRVDVRLLLTLVNNWDDYGGMNQYVAWDATYGDGTAESHDEFYTDENTKGWYKDHVAAVLDRVNSYNGRRYRDDPTVFAWELANEPRCLLDPAGFVLNGWFEEMGAHVKSLDGNHLVTTGIEGFYNTRNPIRWMDYQGTDFIANHQVPSIDFSVAHSWPDLWELGEDYETTMDLVGQQIADSHTVIGKPFVLEEFGKYRDADGVSTLERDRFYRGYYDLVYGMRGGGTNFWILFHDAYPDSGGFGVYSPADSSTVGIIEEAVAYADGLSSQREFIRGDCHGDGRILLPDVIAILLRMSAPPDRPFDVGCEDACDYDDDGKLTLKDAVGGLRYLFASSRLPEPSAPFPECGADPSPDGFTCDRYEPDLCR